MEGLAGVFSWKDGKPEFDRIRRLMTAEVRAAVEGAQDSGKTFEEILICDSHSFGDNIFVEDLPRGVVLTGGTPRPSYMMQGLSETFDAVFLVGYHAPAGMRSSPMDHSFSSSSIYNLKINGTPMSEAAVNAGYAGFFGVPVVLVSGDQSLIEHIRGLVPEEVETVVTKEGISRFSAKSRHPEDVHDELRQKAKRAVLKAGDIAPVTFEPPFEVELELMDTLRADILEPVPGFERAGGRTVLYHPKDFEELYRLLELALTLLGAAKLFQ
jgi:D-amino peptidase